MTECGYYASDGPTKPSGGTTRTVAADFRKLTPFVLKRALEQAKTVVCEPMIRASAWRRPSEVGRHRYWPRWPGSAAWRERRPRGPDDLTVLETLLPAARAQELQRRLPGLTSGEGVADTSFGGYRPMAGSPGQAQSRDGR